MGAQALILLDSNVWIYYLDAGLPEHAAVRKAVGPRLATEDVLSSPVVQLEVVHYIVKRLEADADDLVDRFLQFPCDAAPLTDAEVVESSRLLLANRASGIGARDATLLVLARQSGAELLTRDKSLARVAKRMGITTTEPGA